MDLISLFDYIGTFVFAISGALVAAEKRFDIFGALTIGFATAVGGGTMRDVMLGVEPVTWICSLSYFYVTIAGVVVTILFQPIVLKMRSTLFLFDSIGIGVFTVIGIHKAQLFNIAPPLAVMMGMITAVAGGIIRDTLCGQVPLIFRKEIYATACIIGGGMYYVMTYINVPEAVNIWLAMIVIVIVRMMAVKFGIQLPLMPDSKKQDSSNTDK